MKIALLEPFFGGSHKRWALGVQKHLDFEVEIFSMPAAHWKWRMHGAAISLAREFNESRFEPQVILASDMLDLCSFLALTRKKTHAVPSAIYFHENQFAYPHSTEPVKRDLHYAFINYVSALCAQKVFFNSSYNRDSFFEGLHSSLKQFPDRRNMQSIKEIERKSEVLALGLDLKSFGENLPRRNSTPILLWNHRWEHDKNPEAFFRALFRLKADGISFQLIVLGESFEKKPDVFELARVQLKEEIIHFGYEPDFETYTSLLKRADILPVTSNQDFFGISIVEAVACGVIPLLPKRLAYHELFESPQYFYDEHEFYERLKSEIQHFPRDQVPDEQILRFDWSNMKEPYHAAMASISF